MSRMVASQNIVTVRIEDEAASFAATFQHPSFYLFFWKKGLQIFTTIFYDCSILLYQLSNLNDDRLTD